MGFNVFDQLMLLQSAALLRTTKVFKLKPDVPLTKHIEESMHKMKKGTDFQRGFCQHILAGDFRSISRQETWEFIVEIECIHMYSGG